VVRAGGARWSSAGGSINSPQLLDAVGDRRPRRARAQGIRDGFRCAASQRTCRITSRARHLRSPRGGPFQRNMRLDRLALASPRFRPRTGLRPNLPAGSPPSQERPRASPSRYPAALHRPPLFRRGHICRRSRKPSRTVLPAGCRAPPGIPRTNPGWRQPTPGRRRPPSSRVCWQPTGIGNAFARALRCFASSRVSPCLRPFIKTESGPVRRRRRMRDRRPRPRHRRHRPSSAGICRMGDDAWRWVDPELRVRGTQASRRGRVGVSRSGRRQHQCRRRHDSGKGRGPDPRPESSAAAPPGA